MDYKDDERRLWGWLTVIGFLAFIGLMWYLAVTEEARNIARANRDLARAARMDEWGDLFSQAGDAFVANFAGIMGIVGPWVVAAALGFVVYKMMQKRGDV